MCAYRDYAEIMYRCHLNGYQDFGTKNGSSHGQELAVTGLFVPRSLDRGREGWSQNHRPASADHFQVENGGNGSKGQPPFSPLRSTSTTPHNFRLIDFVYHSTLGLRVIKKKNKWGDAAEQGTDLGVFSPVYRGASLIRNCLLLGPYSRPMPRALRCSWGGGQFLMREVPL